MGNIAHVITHDCDQKEIYKWFRNEMGLSIAEAKSKMGMVTYDFNDYNGAIKFYEYLNLIPNSDNVLMIAERHKTPNLPMANVISEEALIQDSIIVGELVNHFTRIEGDGHSCIYSRSINEPRPRKCRLCGKEEENG